MLDQNIVVEGCTVVNGSFKLTREQQQKAREQIMEYPLPHVLYRLQKDERVPSDKIDLAIEEWKKFMVTALYADSSVGMISPIIDEVWHAHILFTKEYADFCDLCFGTFVGHAPNWPGASSSDQGGATFINTYKNLFGELPAIWTEHMNASCPADGPGNCTVDPKCDTDDCSTQGG